MTPGKIDVLIATGRVTVEHDNEFRSFRHHTTMLTTLLEATGRFRVRVLEEFRGIGDELLDRFDVVLVMYEGRDDYHSGGMPTSACMWGWRRSAQKKFSPARCASRNCS